MSRGRAGTARVVGAAFGLVALAGCAVDEPTTVADIIVEDGFSVSIVADGFGGPTQVVPMADGDLIVAELNGGEGDGTGRVLRVDGHDPTRRTVLVDGLVTPTGVAVVDQRLWIMERRRLSVGPLGDPTDRTVVLDDLPFNGRSQGSLTPLEPGGVIYDTSGSRDPSRRDELRPGSGMLWLLTSPDAEPRPYATGFKHAYGHVVDGDGVLWSTEMSDGRLDGVVPPDELVRVAEGDDFGYPRCVGDGTPVVELGADDRICGETPRSHALFEPGATPTSVAVAPWDPDVLVVALWNRGEVVTVPRTAAGRPHRAQVLLAGVANPQHLVADGDRLLLSEFSGGRVLAVGRS